MMSGIGKTSRLTTPVAVTQRLAGCMARTFAYLYSILPVRQAPRLGEFT